MSAHAIRELSELIRPGIYRHYKNKEYEVIGCAKHTETEEEYVVYRNLYGDQTLSIRPKSMFTEYVEVNGWEVPRFQYIREKVDQEK
jgi:hypothetical protein